jgi:hypothetical protein
MKSICLHEWLRWSGAIGNMPACILCVGVYSAAGVVWNCVLMFFILIIYSVEYRILE